MKSSSKEESLVGTREIHAGPRGLPYWQGLDGLRGIAVLAVLAYHANFDFAAGGHIGVDVFFTLSGFLITTILLGERLKQGSIKLGYFYMRRVLRLVPALLVVAPIAVGFGVVLDLPESEETISALPWVLGYAGNWLQAFGRELGLLSHTWSLAVEEQFYLLWPPLLLGLGVALEDGARRRRIGLALILVAGLVGVLRAAAWDQVTVERLYFGLDSRSDTLLLGGALAFLSIDRTAKPTVSLPWTGLASALFLVIIATSVPRESSFLYLGGYSLVAVASTVLTATLVLSEGSLLNRVTEHRTLAFVGVISYEVYLWHFPIYLAARERLPATPVTYMLTISAVFVFSIATHYLISARFLRMKDRWSRRIVSVEAQLEKGATP